MFIKCSYFAVKELVIRNLPVIRAGKPSASSSPVKPLSSQNPLFRRSARFTKRYRKRLVRYGLLFGNLAVVVVAIVMVARHSGGNSQNSSILNTATEAKISNPLDTLSATDIAANVAILAEMPETGLIINEADSVSASLDTAVVSREAVYKPQILSSDIKTKADIIDYVAVEGDTLASLAGKFGVTSDSIRWSNNLSGSTIRVGTKLVIPPVNGVVYTVKAGDTAEALGNRYNVSKEAIIRFNDAEVNGFTAGERIVIPDGTIRAVARSRTPYYAGFAFGNAAIYGYNGYVPGYCTWYVANKRMQIGKPLPANLGNASTWDNYAPQGWDRNPRPGDAVVTKESGAGHVAFVEAVYEDGSVLVSEMNRRRRYEITTRVFGPAEAATYKYIH